MNHIFQSIIAEEYYNATSIALRDVQQNDPRIVSPVQSPGRSIDLPQGSSSRPQQVVREQDIYQQNLSNNNIVQRPGVNIDLTVPTFDNDDARAEALKPDSRVQKDPSETVREEDYLEENNTYSPQPSYGGGGGGGFIPPSMGGEEPENQIPENELLAKPKKKLKPIIITAAIIGVAIFVLKP